MEPASLDGDPPFPERVGRYELLLPIGAGGMANVYLARSRGVGGFEREVALKIAHAHLREEADFTTGLLEEAKLVARLHHPNIVAVLDVGEDRWGVYLVMQYIEGDTLAGLAKWHRARGDRLPVPIALRILDDALRGLQAAHELHDEAGKSLSLVHRDFSPHNILVGIDGVARLADFGIAKVANRIAMTRSGMLKGKVQYAAPEQARGQDLDRRCDVWAAGVIAWELLVGGPLYPRGDDLATLLRIVSEDPPRVRSACDDVTEALDEVVAAALVRDPERRIGSAEELRRRLAEAWGRALPDVSEVAEHLRGAVGLKLKERRARIDEVQRLRGKMGAIAPTSGEPTPSAAQNPATMELARADATHTVKTITDPMAPRVSWTAAASPKAMPAIATVAEERPTENARAPSRRNRWLLVTGGAAAVAVAVAVTVSWPPAAVNSPGPTAANASTTLPTASAPSEGSALGAASSAAGPVSGTWGVPSSALGLPPSPSAAAAPPGKAPPVGKRRGAVVATPPSVSPVIRELPSTTAPRSPPPLPPDPLLQGGS
jgi:serine/threonine protein kinase